MASGAQATKGSRGNGKSKSSVSGRGNYKPQKVNATQRPAQQNKRTMSAAEVQRIAEVSLEEARIRSARTQYLDDAAKLATINENLDAVVALRKETVNMIQSSLEYEEDGVWSKSYSSPDDETVARIATSTSLTDVNKETHPVTQLIQPQPHHYESKSALFDSGATCNTLSSADELDETTSADAGLITATGARLAVDTAGTGTMYSYDTDGTLQATVVPGL